MSDKFNTAALRASYGVGRQMGDQLSANPFDGVDAQAVAAGLIDSLENKESAVSTADIDAAFGEISKIMQAKQQEEGKVLAVEGEKFLAENAKKAGITTTNSGLQYEIMTEGSGEKPSKESTVKTHYHGTLIDGTVFDSSVERNSPAEFPVSGVIAGWTEALQLMPVGSKWRLFIPYQLAYGEQGAGGSIKPYSALVFEVELLKIIS